MLKKKTQKFCALDNFAHKHKSIARPINYVLEVEIYGQCNVNWFFISFAKMLNKMTMTMMMMEVGNSNESMKASYIRSYV